MRYNDKKFINTIASDPHFFLRKESGEFKMSTLEAIALAMGIIESNTVKDTLMKVYSEKLNRTLIGRGLIKPE